MNRIRVLSFGAGTQSSALLGLIEEGRLPPVDFAVFADTQCEPDEVYVWLDKIKSYVKKTKLVIATAGDLMQDALDAASGGGLRFASLPLCLSTRTATPLMTRKASLKDSVRLNTKLQLCKRLCVWNLVTSRVST